MLKMIKVKYKFPYFTFMLQSKIKLSKYLKKILWI